jgi:HAD superfamily hydrolase (TIGR01490 family)
VAAFFDMDKTLIAENSASVYMKRRYRDGKIGAVQLALAYLRYKLGLLDLVESTRGLMVPLAGREVVEVWAEGQALCEESIFSLVYPGAVERVRHHQTRGDLVCIVSGSMGFVVDHVAAHLDIDHAIYTRVEEKAGRLTGEVVEPLCYERGKLYWLREFIQEHEIDLSKSWFYSDSITDLPLLEEVGHPVAVNPDPRLYRLARRRGWPIRLFDLDHSPPRKSRKKISTAPSIRS